MARQMRVSRRRKKNTFLPMLLLLVFALVLSLGIAALWQGVSGDNEKLASSSEAALRASLAQQASSTSKSEPSSEPESEPEPVPVKNADGSLPENGRVKNDYFDDAVFVGDSITVGIAEYGMMENTTVLAGTGINIGTAYTTDVVKQEDGSRIPIMEALGKKQYEKVYLMLGGNEVRDEEKDAFIKRYSKLIDDVRALQPDALFYVQSILPVTKNNNYRMDNARIDDFNAALSGLCAEKNVYYLNVAECMKDENGALPTEASPADGMHFGPDYFLKWFDYLKTHTAPDSASSEESAK